MEPDTFLIVWRGGNWRIGYHGEWYGSYECSRSSGISGARCPFGA